MTKRVSRISTRRGDDGSTGLGDGTRTVKNSLRIAALGEVDETNAVLGVLLCEALEDDARAMLTRVQHDLFSLGGQVCVPGATGLDAARVTWLEAEIERMDAQLPRLKCFILPGGTRAAALAHQARTVCRRAERALVALAAMEAVDAVSRQYMNRLSDLLFVLGRYLNHQAGGEDVPWQQALG